MAAATLEPRNQLTLFAAKMPPAAPLGAAATAVAAAAVAAAMVTQVPRKSFDDRAARDP